MNKYQDCSLFVDKNGKYCCVPKKCFSVGDGCCAYIDVVGTGPLELIKLPTGSSEETEMVAQVLDAGTTIINDPGRYYVKIDCEVWEGVEAPEDPTTWAAVCCSVYEKTVFDVLSIQFEALCEKIVQSNDPTAIAEILTEIQALCQKILALTLAIENLAAIQTETNVKLDTLITTLTEGFDAVVTCLGEIKTGQQDILTCLEEIKGDPSDCQCPTPMFPECDVSMFITYAQAEFTITGLAIPGVDIAGKFNFPYNGNSLPESQDFKNILVDCIEGAGYSVTEQQGRDGWLLNWRGPCPEVLTEGAGTIVPECSNCSIPDDGTGGGDDDLTGKTFTYENTDNETELAVSISPDTTIELKGGNGDGSEEPFMVCLTECLNAGHDVQLEWEIIGGGGGMATVVGDEPYNAPPEFSAAATATAGDSGKIQKIVLKCL